MMNVGDVLYEAYVSSSHFAGQIYFHKYRVAKFTPCGVRFEPEPGQVKGKWIGRHNKKYCKTKQEAVVSLYWRSRAWKEISETRVDIANKRMGLAEKWLGENMKKEEER